MSHLFARGLCLISLSLPRALYALGPHPASPPPASDPAPQALLRGMVQDEGGRPVAGATVRLLNRISGYRQAVKTQADGRFGFHNVPLNDYHLEVLAPGLAELHRELELRGALPRDLQLVLKAAGATVTVEETLSLVEEHPSVHLDIDRSTIEKIPTPVQSRALESILLAAPGFVANDNGRFHFRGSHGQLTYVIDGVPLSDQTHASYSNSLDPAQVEGLEIITGGISAEYGGKPIAVVNMTTKSGLGTPGGFGGELSFGTASAKTREAGFSLRGCTDRTGFFITGAASRSDRFLDPVDFRNFHNQGETGRLFSRFDALLGEQDTLRFSVSGGRTRRDVVNLQSQEQAGMDQGLTTQDANFSLAWNHLFSERQSLEALLYQRRATSILRPTQNLAEGFAAGGPDFPVWARQERRLENQGAQLTYAQRFGADSTLRAGLQHVAFPLRESFRFAITSDTYVTDPDLPLYAYTPAGGGSIWAFEARLRPTLASAFLQTDLHLGNTFLALGLRQDTWALGEDRTSQLQPRLGLSQRFPNTRTVLRASYDRLLVTPDRENLALSSSQEAAELTEEPGHAGHEPGTHRVRPEVQDAWSLGLEQQFGAWGRLSLEFWERRSRNTADVAQFANTGIEFPVALAHGFFKGFNLRLDLAETRGWSGYLSLGRTRALVEGPLVGGLELRTGGHGHEEPLGRFPIDHDQKLSLQLGLRYEHQGWWIQALGRHDSGLVSGDPEAAEGNPDLAFGLEHVRYDSSDHVWRVKPRTLWNFGLGRALKLDVRRSLTLSADVLNAFDKKTLYNFLSHRGGTHVHPERTWALRAKLGF